MVILNATASKINLSTAGLDKKFDINNDPDNAKSFKQQKDKAFDEYCWGSAISAIPIDWDTNGDPIKAHIAKMMEKMQNLKTNIESESKKVYDEFEVHLFNACEKSTNQQFNKYAIDFKNDWETDKAGAIN